MNNIKYYNKYIKYYNKYIILKTKGGSDEINSDILSTDISDIDLYKSSENNSKEECEKNIIIYNNEGIRETYFPFITTQEQIDSCIKLSLNMTPTNEIYNEKYNREKYEMEVYKDIGNESIINTINYIFNKMKMGVFVRIHDNILANYIPIYNINYMNDFYKKLKFKEGNVRDYVKNKQKKIKNHTKINYDIRKWSSTNCLLRNELDDTFPTQAYLDEMYDLLRQVVHNRKINDCIFFINRKDFPYLDGNYNESYEHIYGNNIKLNDKYTQQSFIPILSQSSTITHADIPIPTGDDWQLITQMYFITENNKCNNIYLLDDKDIPIWEDRKNIVFWRGMSTGCGNTIETNPRLKLTKMSFDLKKEGKIYLDAGIVKFTKRDKKNINSEFVEYFTNDENIEPLEYVDRFEQMKYKYIINIEGNSAAYRYGSLFKLGYCVLNIESKYKLWFEPFLIENTHYIKIKSDLSDLVTKIEWCLKNDDICKQIAKNGIDFYKKYFNKEFIYDYMEDILNKISSMYSNYDGTIDIVPYDKIKQYRDDYNNRYQLKLEKIILNNICDVSKMCIIVSYRDNKYQDRLKQLKEFVKHYIKYNIVIVEQSQDNRKFNRGALMNVGYKYIKNNKKYNDIKCIVIHDVDLILDNEIVERYYCNMEYPIIHLGRLIKDYYETIPHFLGGILKINNDIFEQINGFPNNFYGWGMEDDALRHRINNNNYTVYLPDIEKSGVELIHKDTKKIPELTNLKRLESGLADELLWKINGVKQIQFKILKTKAIYDNITKITVELS